MTGKYLISRPINLGVCSRCGAYVFVAADSGLDIVADIAPLDVDQMRAALIAQRTVYDQIDDARGKPQWLDIRSSYSKWPPKGKVVAQHGCRGAQVKAVEAANPRLSPVSPTGTGTVNGATSRRSDGNTVRYVYIKCEVCDEFIGLEKDLVGVQYHHMWEWVIHGRCVDGPVRKAEENA